MRKRRFLKSSVLAVAAGSALAAPVLAQAPTMPAIDFPVDTASIVTAVVAAGVAVLILWWPVKIGFKLVHRLTSKLAKSAG